MQRDPLVEGTRSVRNAEEPLEDGMSSPRTEPSDGRRSEVRQTIRKRQDDGR